MKHCLSERALVLLSVGEGRAAERQHCAECPSCAERLRALAADLDGIGAVLRAAPPPLVARQPRRSPSWGFVPALAVAALVAVVGAHRLLQVRPVEPGSERGRTTDSSLSASAQEVSEALFDTSGERAVLAMALPSGARARRIVTEAPEVERALGLGSPCTGDRFVGADCNDYTSALFF
jgi:hypothetical protein